jgi:tetratricopeptide (TPR) repeat protein
MEGRGLCIKLGPVLGPYVFAVIIAAPSADAWKIPTCTNSRWDAMARTSRFSVDQDSCDFTICGMADKKGKSSMNRNNKCLRIALLAGAAMFFTGGLCAQAWAQTQNPPQKKVVEQKKENPPEEYTEEEYNAYQAVADETDPTKKAALIIAFIEKYPKSKLLPNVTPLYDTLLYEVHKAGDYKKLQQLAEQWLKRNPDNLQVQAYLFDAAVKLVEYDKVVEYGEKIYARKPSADLAYALYNGYDKLGNKAKKMEGQLRLLEYPEYRDNVALLWGLVAEYADKDLAKAAAYAERTLKAMAAGKRPENIPEAEWSRTAHNVERGCYDIIGMNLFGQKKYALALEALQQAVKVECYELGYYYIAQCHWNLNQPEEAHDNFAVADLLGGKMSAQAKKHCLDIYKSLHNGTDTGINKVYRRAKAVVSACKK